MKQDVLAKLKEQRLSPVYTLKAPCNIEHRIPLVLDSPHSGNIFPSDFQSIATQQDLMTGWDAFVDDLWGDAPENGAYLLAFHAPRTYIDLNRAPDDIAPHLLDGDWIGPCHPTEKYSGRGMGLIREYALPNVPVYDKKIPPEYVHHRLEHYYRPYHNALSSLLDDLHGQYKQRWHINCHSMKSAGNAMNIDHGKPRPDIVLGNLDNTSSSEEFINLIADLFVAKGYSVVLNDPYKGGYLVAAYGHPQKQQHSLQIEINRSLYLNESTFQPNQNYTALKEDLSTILLGISSYIKAQIKDHIAV